MIFLEDAYTSLFCVGKKLKRFLTSHEILKHFLVYEICIAFIQYHTNRGRKEKGTKEEREGERGEGEREIKRAKEDCRCFILNIDPDTWWDFLWAAKWARAHIMWITRYKYCLLQCFHTNLHLLTSSSLPFPATWFFMDSKNSLSKTNIKLKFNPWL